MTNKINVITIAFSGSKFGHSVAERRSRREEGWEKK